MRMLAFEVREISPGAAITGADGPRVTPLTSSACKLGRASATTGALEFEEDEELLSELAGRPRRKAGGPGSSESRGDGVICALVLPLELLSEFDAARRKLGAPLLFDEVLFDEVLFEEDELLSSELELDPARRSRGRSGSSSIELLLDEFEELLAELLDEEGCDLSMGSDALACSSGVPSRIIEIVLAL